jgi:hypothetical protein
VPIFFDTQYAQNLGTLSYLDWALLVHSESGPRFGTRVALLAAAADAAELLLLEEVEAELEEHHGASAAADAAAAELEKELLLDEAVGVAA